MNRCADTKKRIGSILLIVSALVCAAVPARAEDERNAEIRIHDRTYLVEVAATPQRRAKGLMFRKSLEKDTGMLFVYPDEAHRCFYMKNTFIPLDIAFISQAKKIVDIRRMEILDKTPVCSREKARYALEVNRGFFSRHGIQVGDTVEIPGSSDI